MNLYFIFAIEKDIQVMNLLAIVTTCLALGAKANSIVITRRVKLLSSFSNKFIFFKLFKTDKKRDKHKRKIVMTHGRQSFRKNVTSLEDSSDELTFVPRCISIFIFDKLLEETGGDEFDHNEHGRRDPSFLQAPSFGL